MTSTNMDGSVNLVNSEKTVEFGSVDAAKMKLVATLVPNSHGWNM